MKYTLGKDDMTVLFADKVVTQKSTTINNDCFVHIMKQVDVDALYAYLDDMVDYYQEELRTLAVAKVRTANSTENRECRLLRKKMEVTERKLEHAKKLFQQVAEVDMVVQYAYTNPTLVEEVNSDEFKDVFLSTFTDLKLLVSVGECTFKYLVVEADKELLKYVVKEKELDTFCYKNALKNENTLYTESALPVTMVHPTEAESVVQERNANRKLVKCKDCGEVFVISALEQDSFKRKGLKLPVRCRQCRDDRRHKYEAYRYKLYMLMNRYAELGIEYEYEKLDNALERRKFDIIDKAIEELGNKWN